MRLAVLMVSAAFGGTSASQAAIVRTTFTGVVDAGVYGLGGANESLVGDAFSATYRLDTDAGTLNTDGATYSQFSDSGGVNVSANLKVGFRHIDFGQVTVELVTKESNYSNPPYIFGEDELSYYIDNAYETPGYKHLDNMVASYSGMGTVFSDAKLGTPLTYALNGSDDGTGYFQISGSDGLAFGNLTATSVSVAVLPEPSTWACMMIGLGLVGIVKRGGRDKTGQSRSVAQSTRQTSD